MVLDGLKQFEMKKILILLPVAFIVVLSCETKSYTDENGKIDAKAMFIDNCASCHGETGDAEIGGAKNLKLSTLSKDEVYDVITNGTGNGMMAYKNVIKAEAERKALADYVMGFRE